MGRTLKGWQLVYDGWDPQEQPLREALTTLGNGFFATRGAAEEARAGGPHYPGTYIAGGYNRLQSKVAGRVVENEDLVNWPNWLPLVFRCEGGNWLDLDAVHLQSYELCLDMHGGVLERRIQFRDEAGREFSLHSRRLVHMGKPNVAALCWDLTPLNWSGTLEIRSSLVGSVTNSGVERYRDLACHHHEILDAGRSAPDSQFLVAGATQSGLVVAEAARTRIFVTTPGEHLDVESFTTVDGEEVTQRLRVAATAGQTLRVEKLVTLYTSRDFASSNPKEAACTWVRRLPRFDDLLATHQWAWRRLWRRVDLKLTSRHYQPQGALRLHLFHLLQTASLNTIDRDVGLPARGLHGEAYRGHVFWDELFAFPLFNLRLPELTRSFLMYRYRRLDEARHAARAEGHHGAMFPWQSGSDGREETQKVHLNPRSGRWLADDTHRQRHVGSAIAYNVWQYYQATGDLEFLSSHGAELLLEIAHFWASIAVYEPRTGRYEIRGVVGPDEFHTRYPGRERHAGEPPPADEPSGLNNNAYTNVMAAWVLKTSIEALSLLTESRRAELLSSLHVTEDNLQHWDHISRNLYVPFHGDRIISQFDGWHELEELDWDAARRRYGDIRRLDRLLEADGDDVNRYQAAKQADVLMLFFLFSDRELRGLFERLGYSWDDDLIPRTVRYYLDRTSNGSTLSQVVHAWVLASTDRKQSWRLFCEALTTDIEDVQGGTTPEGIHIGAMAGTVDLIQRCYTGLEIRDDALWLDPQLPLGLERLRISIRYRQHWLSLDITQQATTVSVERGSGSVHIGYQDRTHVIACGESRTFDH